MCTHYIHAVCRDCSDLRTLQGPSTVFDCHIDDRRSDTLIGPRNIVESWNIGHSKGLLNELILALSCIPSSRPMRQTLGLPVGWGRPGGLIASRASPNRHRTSLFQSSHDANGHTWLALGRVFVTSLRCLIGLCNPRSDITVPLAWRGRCFARQKRVLQYKLPFAP